MAYVCSACICASIQEAGWVDAVKAVGVGNGQET